MKEAQRFKYFKQRSLKVASRGQEVWSGGCGRAMAEGGTGLDELWGPSQPLESKGPGALDSIIF